MRSIQQAIELLNIIPRSYGRLFCCTSPDSTKPLRNLLAEFELNKYATPEDNTRAELVDAIFEEITKLQKRNESNADICKHLEQIKETINDHLAYYSSENVYVYWRGVDNPISSSPPGIAILCNDSRSKGGRASGDFPLDFKEKAIENLEFIAHTPAGELLLMNLLDQLAQKPDLRIEILPAPFKQGNRAIPHDIVGSMEMVASELSSGKVGEHSRHAMKLAEQENCGSSGVDPFEWLAEKINELPIFSLNAAPEKYTNSHKPFLAKDIAGWFEAGKHGFDYLTKIYDRDSISQLLCATIAVLHDYAEPGIGSGTTVRWNAFSENSNNQRRPAAIGLAHELIHAYYNAKGEEPGKEQDDTTAVIEYLAIGLGPYEGNKMTENAFRIQWHTIVQLMSMKDTLGNNQDPELRTQYNDLVVQEKFGLGMRMRG